MSPLDRRIASGDGDALYDITRPGPADSGHSHRLRVMAIRYSDGDEVWIEASEPGGCGCARRMTLAQMTHVLVNASPSDLGAIEGRELCPEGHPHHFSDRTDRP